MSEENEKTDVGEIEATHPALEILQNLQEQGLIPADVCSDLAFKFNKLNQAFQQSCSTEEVLMRKTRDLDKELKSQKMTIENSVTQQQDHRSQLTALRQFLTNTQVELDATLEQVENTCSNTRAKEKELEKLDSKVQKAKEEHFSKHEPQKKQVQLEIRNLEVAIAERRQKINELQSHAQDMADRMQKADDQLSELDKTKRVSNQKILEIGSFPIKTRQKCAAVESSHNMMLSEEKTSNEQLKSIEQTLLMLQNKSHDMENEFQKVTSEIEIVNGQCEGLKNQYGELKNQIAEQTSLKQQREFDMRRIQKQISEYEKEMANLDQKIEGLNKDIDRKEKEAMKLDEMTTRVRVEKVTLEGQLRVMSQDKEREVERNTDLSKQMAKNTREKEEMLKQLMSMEKVNENLQQQIRESEEERNRKQSIHDSLSNKERDFTQQLLDASLVRDRRAREMAAMKKKTVDAKTMAMEKNLDYLDLCRKLEAFHLQMKEYSELYDKVKMDRNRHVNTIQTSRQLVVEMKEKIHILENEVEVLRDEYAQIAFVVQKQKTNLAQAFKRRDATKVDLKRAELEYQELQAKIDFQSGETDRMNHILQSLEERINHQQERYTAQADDCADRQRMLIDKQDELCIIYEQFNRHEEIMKKGEVALRERDEQIKLLNLEVKDFARRIDIMQRKIPQLRSYDEEIDELERQLVIERRDVDNITKRLEAPNLKERQRAYCGKDFTLKELEDKVSIYEQRINSKEQQLWEKQILLKEITDKIADIKEDATRDTTKTQKMVEKGGQVRAKTMAVRRRKLAALSEMAIYQAKQDELKEQTAEIRREIEEAETRTARGEAFDDFSERMLRMHKRDMEQAAIAKARGVPAYEDDDDDGIVKAGRQKFDAYPTADGLSRPYGAFPVFQPAPPPGYIRHYRKEGERAIEI